LALPWNPVLALPFVLFISKENISNTMESRKLRVVLSQRSTNIKMLEYKIGAKLLDKQNIETTAFEI